MFNKIEIPSTWKEEYTKYPNGKTIWEALSAAMTSFNDFVDVVNQDVQEGLLSIDQAEDTLRGELNATFSGLEDAYALSFAALQNSLETDINTAIATITGKADKSYVDAQLAEKALKTDVGLLSGLLTTDKTSIVNAINQLFNSKANTAQEEWITPTLLNGWVNTTQPIGFMKDSLGFVHVQGRVQSGTIGSTAFVLPVGYRPSANRYFVGSYGVISNILVVTPVGNCYPLNGNNNDVSFDNILFKAV